MLDFPANFQTEKSNLKRKVPSSQSGRNAMNLSIAASPLLAPAAPDFYHCSQFYAQKFVPDYEDCDAAIGLLPTGNGLIPWYLDPQRGDPEMLSYTATHGQ